MHYCGVVATQGAIQLAMLEELRTLEPPVRLTALFYEPGSPEDVARELHRLQDVVVAVGAPLGGLRSGRSGRDCDALLLRRGVAPQTATQETRALAGLLRDLPAFVPDADGPEGQVDDGAYGPYPVFETNADGVFCALQGRRLPARRHPFGLWRRIEE